MSDVETLRKEWQDAEAKAIKLQNDRDEALDKVRTRFNEKLTAAVDEAAAAQKAFLDAQVVDSLRGRDDGEVVARTLGLSLD